ncbi:hypothetical protein ACWD0A_33315, partial [Streptomyces sp. NPDC002867]
MLDIKISRDRPLIDRGLVTVVIGAPEGAILTARDQAGRPWRGPWQYSRRLAAERPGLIGLHTVPGA